MKKIVFASIVIASLAATAYAQTTEKPAKPAAKSTKPVDVKKAPATSKRQAAELATPTEEYDPTDKLSEAELAVAKRVYVGEIPCELGAKVSIKPMKREGYFFVTRGINKFVMHPVESRTGAIRLEDPRAGAMWLQLGNKSMLMSQKMGRRLADECMNPAQAAVNEALKKNPMPSLLEPLSADKVTPAASK
jgi:Ni/Co efflux regulator RcnB